MSSRRASAASPACEELGPDSGDRDARLTWPRFEALARGRAMAPPATPPAASAAWRPRSVVRRLEALLSVWRGLPARRSLAWRASLRRWAERSMAGAFLARLEAVARLLSD